MSTELIAESKDIIVPVKQRGRKDFYSSMPKCTFNIREDKKCNNVAVKNSKYCHHHRPQDEIDSTPPPNPVPVPQSDKEDLNYEIILLKKYLRRIVSENSTKKRLVPEDIRIQLQLIEQIRKLIHSLSIIESQSKIYNTVTKIIDTIVNKVVELINKHSTDDNLKNILASELMELGNVENENNDLGILLKQLNPKNRTGNANTRL